MSNIFKLLMLGLLMGAGIFVNSQTLNDSLIFYYSFNDGTATDQSGNGLDGTVVGPSQDTDAWGNPNQAFRFDGIDDFVELPADYRI